MRTVVAGVFWISFLGVFYAYLGYPLCLWLLARRGRRHEAPATSAVPPEPPLSSFIITVHNEEERIREKLENTLAQDFPRDRLEIIIASDCSDDATDTIVEAYRQRGVALVRAPERKGKENAQKLAIEASRGEILVFSDVGTKLDPDGLTRIVGNFRDPGVGCVSSEDRFLDAEGRTTGEGAYVRYEMFLRKLETRVNSVVGLSGSFFAARRSVCENWAGDQQSDFSTLLRSVEKGLRGILDPGSVGYYRDLKDPSREFDRKVRTVVRGIGVLARNRRFANPFRFGLFSWQLLSHKLCRWLVPFFLLALLAANLLLLPAGLFYRLAFLAQVLLYGLALLGVRNGEPRFALVRIPTYFLTVNLAILQAWIKYLSGERAIWWDPSRR